MFVSVLDAVIAGLVQADKLNPLALVNVTELVPFHSSSKLSHALLVPALLVKLIVHSELVKSIRVESTFMSTSIALAVALVVTG